MIRYKSERENRKRQILVLFDKERQRSKYPLLDERGGGKRLKLSPTAENIGKRSDPLLVFCPPVQLVCRFRAAKGTPSRERDAAPRDGRREFDSSSGGLKLTNLPG